MARNLVYYCWACYAESTTPAGRCGRCGKPIEAPAATTYVQRLIWALGQPLRDVQMRAASILGERAETAAAVHLRRLVLESPDPFLAAESLKSLIAIEGVEPLRELLAELAESAAVQVRAVARTALAEASAGGEVEP